MNIVLMNNSSPANYVTKSVTTVASLQGELRNPCSIIDPSILIEGGSPTGFNYMYIPEFNRYYFVNDVITQSNRIMIVNGHVDVLVTYREQIRQFNAIVRRQQNVYNLYLDDGLFKAYQNPKHKIIKFPNKLNNFSYILVLASNS